MKKITLLAAFVFTALFSQAQDSNTGLEIGLKISPSISSNRVVAPSAFGIKKEGTKARFGIGLVLDYFFSDNYAFSTGIEYAMKGSGVTYNRLSSNTNGNAPRTITNEKITDEFNVQYLQIPVGFKLYTNEVSTDTRIFFQLGTSLNARIAGTLNGDKFYQDDNGADIKSYKRFNIFEADAVIGAGVEMQLGTNTKVFGGLSYHRGLTDIDNYYEDYYKDFSNSNDIAIKNGTVALDLGLKF